MSVVAWFRVASVVVVSGYNGNCGCASGGSYHKVAITALWWFLNSHFCDCETTAVVATSPVVLIGLVITT